MLHYLAELTRYRVPTLDGLEREWKELWLLGDCWNSTAESRFEWSRAGHPVQLLVSNLWDNGGGARRVVGATIGIYESMTVTVHLH